MIMVEMVGAGGDVLEDMRWIGWKKVAELLVAVV